MYCTISYRCVMAVLWFRSVWGRGCFNWPRFRCAACASKLQAVWPIPSEFISDKTGHHCIHLATYYEAVNSLPQMHHDVGC